jgi:hypothetical protein
MLLLLYWESKLRPTDPRVSDVTTSLLASRTQISKSSPSTLAPPPPPCRPYHVPLDRHAPGKPPSSSSPPSTYVSHTAAAHTLSTVQRSAHVLRPRSPMSQTRVTPPAASTTGGAGSGGDEEEERRRRNRQRAMQNSAATALKQRLAKSKRRPKEKEKGKEKGKGRGRPIAPEDEPIVPRVELDEALRGKLNALLVALLTHFAPYRS